MIVLHKLNGAPFTINAELIETVEATPDTVISLTTGNRYVVQESVEVVAQRALDYRRKVFADRKDPFEKAKEGRE